ncbi:MAG: ABC transporter ATP-binding protein [Proteobacteria bacterium]|nr:ABC transporter ATP-binding protein [Pseudomonadota bacterium]
MTIRILEAENIKVSFGGLKALDGASLYVEEGKVFSLIGPNGAGKTTFFNVIAGSLRPNSGKIRFMGQDITSLKSHEICKKGIARTFQLKNAFLNLNVFENVKAGLLKSKIDKTAMRERVFEILEFLDIGEIAEKTVSEITPLEAKFVELGRALATNPKLVLLDELIGGLLPSETEQICKIVEKLREQGYSVLQIGHEIKPIMRTSDRVFVQDQGRKVADGTPEEIRRNEEVISCYLE